MTSSIRLSLPYTTALSPDIFRTKQMGGEITFSFSEEVVCVCV